MKPFVRKLLIIAVILIVVIGGAGFWLMQGHPAEHSVDELSGKNPVLSEPLNELIPSVALAKTTGWGAGQAPRAASGLTVTRFAEGLQHPRTMLTLPNGDVLVAETGAPAGNRPSGLTGFVMGLFMSEVGATDPSPNRIALLRDADGDGKAEARFVLRSADLDAPSGLAWANGK